LRQQGRKGIELVAQFDDDPFCGLLADAGQPRQRGGVSRRHETSQVIAAGTGKNGQGELGTDAADFQQLPEQQPF
jgi:hypothetical protein